MRTWTVSLPRLTLAFMLATENCPPAVTTSKETWSHRTGRAAVSRRSLSFQHFSPKAAVGGANHLCAQALNAGGSAPFVLHLWELLLVVVPRKVA